MSEVQEQGLSTCLHFLAKDGACPCGWTAPSPARAMTPPPAPAREVVALAHVEEPEPEDTGPDLAEMDREFRVLQALKCKRSLYYFLQKSWHVLEPGGIALDKNWHIEAICNHVQWILEDWMEAKKDPLRRKVRMQNAFFSLPPGSLKTRIIMECAPAWMWLRDPSWTVRCLSTNPHKALESADKMRILVTSPWYQETFQPDWEMREDQDAKGNFGNTRGGARYSAGIAAKIVGSRTDALFVDDPNDPASGDEACEKINALWDSTLGSRVNDRRISVCVVVQQRIHVKDLTGHVAKKKNWSGLVLPLLFDPNRKGQTIYGWCDPRTIPGECIHPDRFTPEVVDYMRHEEYGERMFQAQCQQDPDAADGECFKQAWWNWFRISDAKTNSSWRRPEGSRQDDCIIIERDRWGKLDVTKVVITVDATGGSENEGASHVGLLGCALKDEKRLVLHDFDPGPRSWNDTVAALDLAIPVMAKLTGHMRIHVLIEKKALGKALSETVEKHVKETGYTVDDTRIAVTVEDYEPPAGDKKTRGQAMEVPMALGEIYVPEGASWLSTFFAEFKRFPKKPNDKVDALAQFVDRFRKKMGWKEAFKAAGR